MLFYIEHSGGWINEGSSLWLSDGDREDHLLLTGCSSTGAVWYNAHVFRDLPEFFLRSTVTTVDPGGAVG